MRKTTPSFFVFLIALVAALPATAAPRTRIANLGHAVLSGRVVDVTTANPIIGLEVEGAGFFARTDAAGRFTVEVPIGQAINFTFRRSGYEPFNETITVTGRTERTFQLRSLPAARITSVDGVTRFVDRDSIEFGWAVPFSGYRRDRSARMCRAGQGEFLLDRNQLERVEGPALTATETSCCATNPLTGATFQLANGDRYTAYFLESCNSAVMEVIARDHVTYELVFVPIRDLRELVF